MSTEMVQNGVIFALQSGLKTEADPGSRNGASVYHKSRTPSHLAGSAISDLLKEELEQVV